MTNHKTVQLLHFPPDYVLERDQDYLSAHTTLRWAELLVENGAKLSETARYQNIVDIAPIAAPSNAGADLEGVYDKYDDYIKALLNLWLPRKDTTVRPMVAFGGPVRGWLKKQYGLDLCVLDLGAAPISASINAPVLAANHPSFIYNFIKSLKDDPNTPEDERIVATMRVMQQDLVAARWQVQMSAGANPDPRSTLNSCVAYWSDPSRRTRICELTYMQALDKPEDEARQLCAVLPGPSIEVMAVGPQDRLHSVDRLIDRIRDKIGPLDSREPDKIDPL